MYSIEATSLIWIKLNLQIQNLQNAVVLPFGLIYKTFDNNTIIIVFLYVLYECFPLKYEGVCRKVAFWQN